MTNHINEQTIAAFIDGEPVAAGPLCEALALPEGREYLIDLVALRGLIVSDSMGAASASAGVSASRGGRWRALAMAAALLLALLGGYFAGTRTALESGVSVVQAPRVSDAPPTPTVVITVERWQDTQKGGGS